MVTKSMWALSLLTLTVSSVGAQTQFGIVQLDGAGHATLVVAQPMGKDQTVHFQQPGAKGRAVCCQHLPAGAWHRPVNANAVASNEVSGEEPVTYIADVPPAWSRTPFVGAAVVGRRLQATGQGRSLMVRTPQGARRTAHVCTSQEGVHLQEKAGATERTHLYLGLGYEVAQPDCR